MEINVKQIVNASGLSRKAAAVALFPDHKAPHAAFDRISAGKTELTAKQAYVLARLIGVTVDDLYGVSQWIERKINHDHLTSFTRGDYFCVLDTRKYLMDIYTDEGAPVRMGIMIPRFETLETLFNETNKIIEDYEDKNRIRNRRYQYIQRRKRNSDTSVPTSRTKRAPLGRFYHAAISWDGRKELAKHIKEFDGSVQSEEEFYQKHGIHPFPDDSTGGGDPSESEILGEEPQSGDQDEA